MSTAPPIGPAFASIEALLEGFVERIASRVAEKLATAAPADPIVRLRDRPLGIGSRALRDAGRRGEFPTCLLGRESAAKLSDIRAWAESRTPKRRGRPIAASPPAPAANDVLSELQRAGYDVGGRKAASR